MKRFLAAVLLVAGLALVAACGSSGGGQPATDGTGGGTSKEEGRAPPTVSPSAVVTQAVTATRVAPLAGALADRLEEMTLDKADVPAGFSSLGSMKLDFDFDTLGLASIPNGTAQMTIFMRELSGEPSDEIGGEMIVSMVILMDDEKVVDEALSQIEGLSSEGMEEAFNMVGQYMDVTLLDSRVLDASGLGEGGFGFGLTMEVPQVGTMDGNFVFFGRGPVLAGAMTMDMSGGAALDVLPLAERMDAKVAAALR